MSRLAGASGVAPDRSGRPGPHSAHPPNSGQDPKVQGRRSRPLERSFPFRSRRLPAITNSIPVHQRYVEIYGEAKFRKFSMTEPKILCDTKRTWTSIYPFYIRQCIDCCYKKWVSVKSRIIIRLLTNTTWGGNWIWSKICGITLSKRNGSTTRL